MSWIGDKAEGTANVLKELLMQTPAAKLYRQGLPNVLDALLNTREEEWRAKVQAMPKPFESSPEAINRDTEAALAFWNPAGIVGGISRAAKIHKPTGLPLNPDGTVTLYHGTTKAGAEGIAKDGLLKSAGEPHVYLTTDKAGGEYGDGTVVALDVLASLLQLDDEFPGGRKDFAVNVNKPGGSLKVRVRK